MNKTIGFIGSGNMGGAMIGGIIKAGLTAKENIYVSDINEESLARVRESYGVNTTTDNAQLACKRSASTAHPKTFHLTQSRTSARTSCRKPSAPFARRSNLSAAKCASTRR